MKYDFSGWATRNNRKCSDGRTIIKDAFKDNDGQIVPLVWNHQHNDPYNVLGHALLENRDDGVYAYCTFNDTEQGQNAKMLVNHGDIVSLSIYANQLRQNGGNVLHGMIREVSLVLAGANPGAYIENVISHGEDSSDDEAILYFVDEHPTLNHADNDSNNDSEGEKDMAENTEKNTEKEETIVDVFETLTEKQKLAVYALVGQALSDGEDDENNDEGDKNMKHNVFDNDNENTETLSHSEMKAVIDDAKRYGSLKESALAHGIEGVDFLFPEDHNLNRTPEFIKRDTGWVQKVMGAVHHTPFSRIKSTFADLTAEEARAKGYIKGRMKKEEVFSLLKRSTTPTTVYKKQKMERDDMVDITDFDVVAWLKAEMRMMLDEELARAYLMGDGRLASSDDKINEGNIRPIVSDAALFTVQRRVSGADSEELAKNFIKTILRARKEYKGSGNPTLYTTEDMVTECLLLEDDIGRTLYEDVEKLARKLRVKEIVTVPPMETAKGKFGGDLLGIVVNLNDYTVGADKGGAVNMFDDFDIDYNAQKYLIETRCSGALTVPFSAIAIEKDTGTEPEEPDEDDGDIIRPGN